MKWYNWLIIGAAVYLMSACCPSEASLKDRIVRIKSEKGMCTGEQVRAPSGESYILTAGHCRPLVQPDGTVTVQTEQHTELKRKFIAEDPQSDLMLIEGLPKMEGLTIGDFVANSNQVVVSITHGGNLDLYKTEGMTVEKAKIPIPLGVIESEAEEAECRSMPKREVADSMFGKVCVLHTWELITTVPVRPGSSGGPIFNGQGEVVGVVSAVDSYGFGSFITLDDIHKFLKAY